MRFENTGEQLHHALFFPIAKGKTIKDAEAAVHVGRAARAVRRRSTSPRPSGRQVIDGGIAQNLALDLTAGSYAVVCFIQDRKGGKPHVAKGMIEELTVE